MRYTRKRGGFIKKDKTINSWEAVQRMIHVPGAVLTKIAYSSL